MLRFARRRSILSPSVLVAAALLALLPLASAPAAAQASGGSSCAASLQSAVGPSLDFGIPSFRPLLPEERLLHSLGDRSEGMLEVRYFVDGALHLTESVELVAGEPQPAIEGARQAELAPAATPALAPPDEPYQRVYELLQLRPDLVRDLHGLAAAGSRIDVEILQDGERIAALSFAELLDASALLRGRPLQPVWIDAAISGPGDDGPPKRTFAPRTYLEDCWDCTSTTPCDTECGWDEGKGGPTTCGEYGAPCQEPGCACDIVVSTFWTAWSTYNSYVYSPYTSACYYDTYSGQLQHVLYVVQQQRNQIERHRVCPSCPSCTGCYYNDVVIGSQTRNVTCWQNTYFGCAFPTYAPCYQLCTINGQSGC